MKICFMGSMEFAVPILEALNKKYDVALVVTQPDKPVGRKRILTPTKVKEKALELGIDLFQPINIKNDYKKITDLDLDFIIVAAYGQMIPEIVLQHAKYQAINVHASLLPKYRGGSPMHRAIQYGDSKTGVTIMFMANKMDSGDILSQKSIPINDDDNVKTLEEKLSKIGSDLLIETLDNINQINPIEQDINKVTFAYNIKPEEERITFNMSAKDIRNHIRGFNPWPLTYCVIDSLKLKLFEVEVVNENLNKNIGEIVKINKNGIYIQTLDGLVVLKEVQLQGKKRMKINDFMNGIGKTLLILGKKFD
ncbi:methionyl-tRNA formyltransferase [Candidatus Izemoplasma sp. B36]|uniref:methionyl-tRNA formyltransferase n=1 Tax=Candidatus Izemoplasma sp. B36 TaxID=3242468 RepID=UPI0035589783